VKASKREAAFASQSIVDRPGPVAGRCVAALACLLALAMAAQAAPGGTLTVALGGDLRSTDPGVNRDDFTDAVLSHVIEPLVTFREDLSVAPMLAESWERSADGRTYTFRLRSGVRFHDGSALTADTIRWNWQRFLDPATGWSCRAQFSPGGIAPVSSVEAPDERTVVFRLEKATPVFLTMLASVQCLPGAYARSSVDAGGKWIKPVGTGPFVFGEWRRGRDVTLTRNPAYQSRIEPADGLAGERRPATDRIRFLVIPDVTASIQAFNAGQVDVLPNLSPNVTADVQQRAGVQLVPQQLLGWTVLLLQSKAPPLTDLRVRRAIAHALDRAQVARIATAGRGRPNPSAVPVGSAWRTATHDEFPAYDPARAKALLREAGYRGEPVVIQTNRHYPNMYDNAVMAQALLQAVGINARIEVLDWATQLSNYQKGRFQISSFSYSARFDPALTYDLLLGDKKSRPTVQWESADAAKLLAAALSTDDAAQRRGIFGQLHVAMARDVPVIGLYNGVGVTAVAAGVEGYRTWPGSTPILWGTFRQ
jgi:peptide/nickel transport system substrate-binding protein